MEQVYLGAMHYVPILRFVWVQMVGPPTNALFFRSIWDKRGNFIPILAAVPLYRIFQLAVFFSCPFTSTRKCLVDARIQGIMPSTRALCSGSTRHQCGNFNPILAAVYSNRIFQPVVFVGCPFAGTPRRRVDARMQDIMPSTRTLSFGSTRNHCGNFNPILAPVPLY
jgi:hypothetical protein